MIKSPHPALDLSFMRTLTRAEGGGIHYWDVATTGSYGTDCERGRNLGEEYLAYIGKHPTNFNLTLLTCIVLDMADHPAKGLKVGFLATVNQYAMAAAKVMSALDVEPAGGGATP